MNNAMAALARLLHLSWFITAFIGVILLPSGLGAQSIPILLDKTEPTPARGEESVLDSIPPGHVKDLLEHSEDQEMWLQELRRQEEIGYSDESFMSVRHNDPSFILDISDNYQSRGVALRHLQRYYEALTMYFNSERELKYLSASSRCAEQPWTNLCDEINKKRYTGWTLIAYAHKYLQDYPEAISSHQIALALAMDANQYKATLEDITSLFMAADNYEGALDNALAQLTKSISASRTSRSASAFHEARRIFVNAFASISWDRQGKRRSDDPQAFGDFFGLSIGRPFKYGMTDPEEDYITFGGLFDMQERLLTDDGHLKKEVINDSAILEQVGYGSMARFEENLNIDAYIRAQLIQGHFEAPAKYLYSKYLAANFAIDFDGRLPCRKNGRTAAPVTVAEIHNRLATSSIVSANTRRMINLFQLGYDWLVDNCEANSVIGVTLSDNSDGVLVMDIVPGGPADQAGLHRGDLLIQIADVTGNGEQLQKRIHKQAIGAPLIITYRRNAIKKQITLTPVEALVLYTRAPANSSAVAQFALGELYFNGQGVPKDLVAAVKWFRKAAEQGYDRAQAELGHAYEKGRGVPQSYEQAVFWFRKAAEQGYAQAQAALGYSYYKGRGIPQSYEQAVVWLRKAADQGYAPAQVGLGFAYAVGHGVPQSHESAVDWYRKAADQGDVTGQHILSLAYLDGQGVSRDAIAAVEWLRKGAQQDDPESEIDLGIAYMRGDGVQRDFERAVDWFRVAANQGNARAQWNLGSMYEQGLGVAQSYENALIWYGKAAGQGDIESTKAINRIHKELSDHTQP